MTYPIPSGEEVIHPHKAIQAWADHAAYLNEEINRLNTVAKDLDEMLEGRCQENARLRKQILAMKAIAREIFNMEQEAE